MAPVKISHVVSFSSEDPRYPVENLLREDELRPWLGCPHDRSRQLRLELQLERASLIGYVDIGNCGCAFLQIEVGRSSWPLEQPYLTLVPSVALMTPADAKLERNRCGVRMFKEADFPALVVGQKWDRLRLTCSQPFNRHSQFGLAFLRVRTPLDPQHPPLDPQHPPLDPQNPPLDPQHPPLEPQNPPPDPQQGLEEAESANSPWCSSPAFSRLFFPEPRWNSREEEQLRTLLQQLEPGARSLARLSRPAQMVLSAARSRALRPRTGTERPGGDPPEDTGGPVVPGSTQDIPAAPIRTHRQPKSRQRAPSSAGSAPAATSRPSKAGGQVGAQSCRERGDSRGTGTCPICSGHFSLELLPTHASTCGDEDPATATLQPSSPHVWVCCPICYQPFSPAEVEQHASSCGEDSGG